LAENPTVVFLCIYFGSIAKMRDFHNILQLLSQAIGVDYSSYFTSVRNELYKLFNKYENKFGAARQQRPSQSTGLTGKKK